MSLKYQQVKQADLCLPAPLRWLTRAFSSITLAVILLSLVMFYGLIGSVPIAYIAQGGLYALVLLTTLVLPVLLLVILAMTRRQGRAPSMFDRLAWITLPIGVALAWWGNGVRRPLGWTKPMAASSPRDHHLSTALTGDDGITVLLLVAVEADPWPVCDQYDLGDDSTDRVQIRQYRRVDGPYRNRTDGCGQHLLRME